MAWRDAQMSPKRRIAFRMGVPVGEIAKGAPSIAINWRPGAAGVAAAGAICVAGRVQDQHTAS